MAGGMRGYTTNPHETQLQLSAPPQSTPFCSLHWPKAAQQAVETERRGFKDQSCIQAEAFAAWNLGKLGIFLADLLRLSKVWLLISPGSPVTQTFQQGTASLPAV